nr:MAG TPA: hypothetical protein [Inoviridae sp.]
MIGLYKEKSILNFQKIIESLEIPHQRRKLESYPLPLHVWRRSALRS